MKKIKSLSLLFIVALLCNSAYAQDDYDYEDELEEDSVRFFIGVNLGAHFANKNSAIIYTGSPSITPFGVEYIFNQQFNQQTFRDYFQHPFDIVEYPIEPRYKTTFEIGAHLGYEINDFLSAFMEINSIQLDFEQFFTVRINDPNNNSPNPILEQIPIIGKENRFNLNMGAQFNYYKLEHTKAYVAFFGNVNGVKMQSNFMVVNNVQYDIFHDRDILSTTKPGGIAYGAGGGLGFKFNLYDKVHVDIYYNVLQNKTNLTEQIQPKGLHHSLGLRVLWK